MFTGIIETQGTVKEVITNGSNYSFWLESSISASLKPDQSVNHDGVCLTVEEVTGNNHKVTAIDETIKKTNLGSWQPGQLINLERCLQLNSRLDGHLVQGHADTTGTCKKRKEKKGSWEFEFTFSKKFAPLIIEKGSICVNGISLTAFDVRKNVFKAAIIPYTFDNTNIKEIQKGDKINLEFDVIGKYLLREMSLRK